MSSETVEFANGASALQKAKQLRQRAGSLRGGYGVPGITYGLGAYGSPIGAVTGVQQHSPATPPVEGGTSPGDAMSTDQFGGAAGDAGGSGTSTGGGM